MTQQASRKAAGPGQIARRKRNRLMRSCSAFAAAIVLSGLWGNAAQAQMVTPPVAARPAPNPASILQMRGAPEVRSIADANLIADSRITLQAPVVPRPLPAPQPANPHARAAAIADQNRIMEGSAGTVVPGGPAPVVGARANGTVSAQGSFAVSSGSATINRDALKDQVQVTTPQAIINWSTFDTATLATTDSYINFLPAGTELEFIGTGANYTVLNRVFGTPDAGGEYRGIAFNGTVTSRLSDAGPIGGNVWFYSPGGILVNNGAAFNVGSLVLSASAINAITGGGTTIDFTGVTQSDSAILIANGASINALNQGSYVAMVAPRIEQAGTVTVNGSVAYVGAEQAQLRIDNGLFDIAIGLGTEDGNGVVHTGTTTGPARQVTQGTNNILTDPDGQGIYMVAVPKNTALTMLVGGSIGYQPASNASMTPNGVLVLGSGTDVQSSVDIRSGTQTIQFDGRDAVDGGGIRMAGATLTSDMTAFASGQFALQVGNNQVFSMGGDGRGGYSLDATGGAGIVVSAIGNGTIDIQGDLTLDSGQDQSVGAPISILAAVDPGSPTGPAGSINIGGSLVADSSGVGRDDFFVIRQNGNTGIGEDAVGGDISLTVSGGGSISVGGDTTLDASAQGGKGEFRSGSSTGGDVSILVEGATSSLNLPNFVQIMTTGISAESLKPGGNGSADLGADSTAGNFSLIVDNGSLDLGFAQIDTSADATNGSDATQPQENSARAGDVTFQFTGGSQDIGGIRVSGNASSGTSFDANGNRISAPVTLGELTFELDGSQTTFGQDFSVFSGTGSIDTAAATTTSFTITNGANVSVGGDFFYDTNNLNDSVVLTVDQGSIFDIDGSLVFAFAGRTADIAADRGVDITINVDNASLLANFIALDSSIENDSFDNLGTAGGDIALNLSNGAVFDAGFTSISSNARGRALGSSATGGNVAITVDSSTFRSTGGVDISANGVAAQSNIDPSDGTSSGQGGSVRFVATGTNPLVDIGDLFISADGRFNFGFEEASFLAPIGGPSGPVGVAAGTLAVPEAAGGLGDGGDASGGTVEMTIETGTFNAASVTVSSSGFGENGTSDIIDDGINPPVAFAGSGGSGTGGTVTFNMVGGTANIDSLTVSANGLGGNGSFSDETIGMPAGDGGNGTGGSATINASGGTLNVTNGIALQALGNAEIFDFGFPFTSIQGNGGTGFGVAAGNGGAGEGGSATLNLIGNTAAVNAATIEISADAYGGEGGSSFTTFSAGVPIPGQTGGSGGDATGGTATLNHTAGTIDSNSVTVTTGAIGGDGGSSFGLSTGQSVGSGGRGGNAAGGTSTINLNQDDASNPTYFVRSVSTGGQGGGGLLSGAGGNGTGGTAELLVNNFDVSLSSAVLDTSGTGGDGGLNDGEAGTGGAGGAGTGGTVRLVVDGPNGELTSDSPIAISSSGRGGAGSAGGDSFNDIDPGGNGGDGGLGTGGRAEVFTTNGGLLDLALDRGIIDTAGIGGSGGAGGNGPIFTGGNGGRGGGAVGGAIVIGSSGGGDMTVSGPSTTVTLQAGATGGRGGDGGLGAGGSTGLVGINGNSAGGTIDVTADGGRLAFNAQLAASTSAIGFADTRPGSAGGDADGGAITIDALGAGSELVVTGGIFADASAAAAQGVHGLGAGVGGSASGGSFDIVLAEGSTVDIASIDVLASGTGASGNGGGSGTGGDVRIAIAADASSLTSINVDVRATGGNSGTVTGSGPGQNGSVGGNAQGGTAVVVVEGTGPLLDSVTGFALNASATAGNGGRGSASNGLVDGYLGGNGGIATGGTASLAIAGDGASLTVDALAFSLRADATGGTGGAGGDNLTGGTIGPGGVVINNQAGNGGIGGAGTGGTVSLEAGSGSTMTLQQSSGPFELAASGFGGRGGSGGNLDLINGGIQGTGGNGGTGTGGSPRLIATGGTIQGDDVSLLALGIGGNGGLGGDDGNATLGPSGNGGDAFGGTPSVETQDGSPGIITLGNLLIDATSLAGGGTFQGIALGGQVTITDASVDPLGLISMGSLTVLASGNATTSGYPSLTISSGSGPITVTGNVSADVSGDILLNFDDDGQLLVGGGVDLFAGGDFRITHTNTALNTISLDVGGNILAQIFGEIDAQAGTAISGNEVFLLAGQSAVINDVRGVPNVQIIAGGNVLVNDAVATGPQGVSNVGGIRIEAGRNPFAFPPVYNPTVTALIVGTVDSYSDISVISGGTARFLAGSTTIASDGISVTTGDDIIVEAGASLTSARSPSNPPDPADPFNGAASIDLFAGGITNLLSAPLTPLASIVVDGSLDANAGAIIARGNAIDGLDGSFTASSMSLDINDAPADGVPRSDDAGLLSANCLEGNICLGSIFADNVIEIGQASNNDVIQLIVQQGTVNANEILITTRNDIVMGTNGIATTLNASNLFSVESIQGDVDLREASISSGQILITAGGSLIGSAALSSTDDIGITVGSSLSAASIDTGGELTTVADVGGALEGFYSVPGDISIGSLTVGAGDVNFDAGGNIDIGVANVPGTDIILTAPGLVQLGFTGSANNIDLDGGFVSVGDIFAFGQIGIVSSSEVQIGSATAGDTLTIDSLGNVSFSGLQAGSDLIVTAPGSISGGDLFAGSLRLDGGFIAIGTASAATIDFVSASDILFDLLQSSSPIQLVAANGRIAAHTGSGDIESDSDVTLDAQEIAVGNITSGGSVVANATVGDASFGTIDAINDITVDAAGSPVLANAISGGNTSITGASVTFNNGTIGGDLALTATDGDIDGNGAVTVGGGIALDAAGNVGFGDLAANGGSFTVAAGGDISFGSASAASDIVMTAPGFLDGGNLSAGGTLSLDAGSVAFDTGNAALIDITSSTDIRFNALTSPSAITLTAANGTIGNNGGSGDIDSDGDVDLVALSIDLGNVTSGGSVGAQATSGDASFGVVDAANDITIVASGTPTLANAISGGDTSITGASVTFNNGTIGGNLALNATAGDIASDVTVTVGGGIALDAAGNVTFGSLAAEGGDFTITAGSDIFADHAEASGNFNATAGGDFTTGLNSIITGGDIVIVAGGIADLGNSSAGGLVDVSAQQIDFVSVAAGQTVTLVTAQGTQSPPVGNGNITGLTVTAGFGDSLIRATDGGDIAISGTIVAEAVQVIADAGSITSGGLNTGRFAILNAAGAITLTGHSVGTNTFFAEGASVELGSSTITNGNVSLVARSGDVSGTGQIDANGELVVSAADAVSLTGDLIAVSGIRINATGIALGNATSDGQISLVATSGGVTSPGRIESGVDLFVQTSGGADLNEIIAGDDIEFLGSGDISIARMEATGENPQGEEVGSNGNFTITGNVFVAEARIADDLVANVTGDFTTGLNSIVTGGDILINAGNIVNLGNSSAGGLIDVQGSEIQFASFDAGSTVDLLTATTSNTVRGNGNIAGGAIDAGTGASSLVATGAINLTGPATIGGSLVVDAGGDVVFPSANTGSDLIVTAGGSIAHGGATSGGELDFVATGDVQGTGDLLSVGAMRISSLDGSVIGQLFSSAGNVSIDAAGLVSFDTVSANGDIGIEAGGPVSGELLRAGSSIQVQTSDAITVDTVDSANTSPGGAFLVGDQGITLRVLSGVEATLNSSSGAVSVTEDVILDNFVQATGESVFLRSAHDLTVQAEATVSTIDIATTGDLDVERAIAPGDIRLYSTGGSATISNTNSGGFTPLTAGTQGTQQVTGGSDVDIFAAADVVVRDRVSATGDLRIQAGDLVDLQAAAAGTTIEVISRDIAIGTGGSLGEANRTESIVFTPLTTEATLGGESSSSSGYRLDNSEFARVFSAGEVSFAVSGSSSGGAVLTIDDLDVVAGSGSSATSNNIAQDGILRLESDGEIEIVGNLTVTGATADTQLQLSADETILIDLANGGLFVLDGNNGLAGSIVAVASNFLAVTPEALAAIEGLSLADIDDRLAQNDGVDRPDGVIRADALTIGTTDSQVFIQNTAPGTAFDDRRGFTVNSLTINDLVDPNLPIVINGVVGSATGVSAIAVTTINTAFDPASTINGCLIANPSSCTVTSHSDGPSDDPLQDLLDDQFDGDPPTGGTIDTTLVELREDPLRSDDPLIDEPVTGAGNEDLWDFGSDEDEECERAEDGTCIAEAAE